MAYLNFQPMCPKSGQEIETFTGIFNDETTIHFVVTVSTIDRESTPSTRKPVREKSGESNGICEYFLLQIVGLDFLQMWDRLIQNLKIKDLYEHG